MAALSYYSERRRLEWWIVVTTLVDVSTILGVRRPAPIGRHWANVLQSTGKHTLKGVYPVLVTLVLLPAGS